MNIFVYYNSCTVVDDYINTIETTLIYILIYIQLLNSMDIYKHRSQEKLSIKNNFTLITCNLLT